MSKLRIGNSPLTNTIYAGRLLKDQHTWAKGRQDVTIDALSAVADYCIRYQDKNDGGLVTLSGGGKRFIISVKVEDFAQLEESGDE